MRIRHLGAADPGQWLEIARRSPYATYFHTPAWASLMASVYPGLSEASQSFRLRDGAIAVLPLLERRRGHRHVAHESMVPGVYGGPIAERVLEAGEVEEILDAAAAVLPSTLRVYGNPFLRTFRGPRETASDFTHLLDLRPGFDEVFRRFHTNHRRSYRRGARAGLTACRASTLEEFRAYHSIYRATRERWGDDARTDDPFSLFEEIFRRQDPNVILWVAKLEGRVVAGDLWLYWNRHNVGWHGAAEPLLFKKFPTNFLLTEIIRDACQRGFDELDFNPSGWKPKLAEFKDHFGAERIYFRCLERRGGSDSGMGGRLKGALAQAARRLRYAGFRRITR